MPRSVDCPRASAPRVKSIRLDDYADPFDTEAMITFVSVVTAAGFWLAFAASVYELMGGAP